jgi:hypothetical protein
MATSGDFQMAIDSRVRCVRAGVPCPPTNAAPDVGEPPGFRTVDPLGSIPEWRVWSVAQSQEFFA